MNHECNERYVCDICHAEIDAKNGVLHAVERSTIIKEEMKFFAIYRWSEEAAKSGTFGFAHKGVCLESQIRIYLARFRWGMMASPLGTHIVKRGA